jgi:small-conductance mechanosensitive channel
MNIDLQVLNQWILPVQTWFMDHVWNMDSVLQLVAIALVVIASSIVGTPIKNSLNNQLSEKIRQNHYLSSIVTSFIKLVPILIAIFLLLILSLAFLKLNLEVIVIILVRTLLGTWFVIQLATSILRANLWSRLIASLAWFLALLYIFGMLGPTLELLSSLGFNVGEIRLTVLSILKATVLLLVLLRIGMWGGDYLERKLATVSELTPSTRVLLSKVVKIFAFILIVAVALNSIGLDMTSLAVFSGAVGIGVGFGLQKVVANLISGIILLVDKSIKPGDVIEISGVYGWISDLRARYASVVTRDGKEYLIPNEDLITNQVINWSFSDRKIRLHISIGISYDSDPQQAIELVTKVASDMDRVLSDPKPVCRLTGFGDNSVDLELRFWISDPKKGVVNIKSNILLGIWNTFKENGIQIPFPQRDVHLDIQPFSKSLPINHGTQSDKVSS